MITNLNQRIAAALQAEECSSPWAELMRLFAVDREAFYLLACDGAGPQTDSRTQQLAALAAHVRTAIAETYEFVARDGGADLITFSGKKTLVPAELVKAVAEFLRAVDGKTSNDGPGGDFVGQKVSEAEVRFKLGGPSERDARHRYLESLRNSR